MSKKSKPVAPTAAHPQIATRLALRGEGDFVNAYHAAAHTMEGAMLLGSIRRSLCEQQPQLFNNWKRLMSDAYRTLYKQLFGVAPVMQEQHAPPHEKASRA